MKARSCGEAREDSCRKPLRDPAAASVDACNKLLGEEGRSLNIQTI